MNEKNTKAIKEIYEKESQKDVPTRLTEVVLREKELSLHWAAWGGDIPLAEKLIEMGYDIERKDAWNCTPVMQAALGGWLDTVIFLVEKGASIDEIDNTGSGIEQITENEQVREYIKSIRLKRVV